jgi:hypothetical protein
MRLMVTMVMMVTVVMMVRTSMRRILVPPRARRSTRDA